ncbi:RNA polymerase II transcription factor B subunit 1 [Termitomyces sp. J132]|nr:RNA polymerase II transcription factor B subunit 1 [Termitomyces sp. J132]
MATVVCSARASYKKSAGVLELTDSALQWTAIAQLHRDLVIAGQITEEEFWDGREHLLLAQAAADAQKKGKSGQLVDPRPEAVDGGEIKIRITPQLVHDIFDEYPVVAKAYSDNVPSNLTEESFWKRYFQSKLFNAHRASIRSTAAQHVVKDDPIFDTYLEKEDDGLEPRRQRNQSVDIFVDLAATSEDHEPTGNEKDITMQPGRQRGALPLIRKFNEHSERLLNSALGAMPASKRQRLEVCSSFTFLQIELEDLQDPKEDAGIALEMQDSQRYFEGRTATLDGDDATKVLDMPAVFRETRANVQGWEQNLLQLKQERKAGDAALFSMTQNVSARLAVQTRKNDIPDGLFRQMTTCQTAANEFLRQFWSAMYPPPMDVQSVNTATPAQRATKAAKMIGYVAKTREKVAALVNVARMHGVDPTRVESALKPVLTAVDQAIAFHQRKMAAGRP